MRLVPVILAGGIGSRLWPMSRKNKPKQFQILYGESFSLFQLTLKRIQTMNFLPPIIVCNESQRFLVAQQMQEVGVTGASIVLEPCPLNTAPSIALAAMEAKFKYSVDATLLILPSDHFVKNLEAFNDAINRSVVEAQDGALVIFGVKPSYPETEYGYICIDEIGEIKKFIEKPNLGMVKKLLSLGNCFWNSGMFVFKAKAYLDQLGKYRPEMLMFMNEAFENRVSDMDFIRVNRESFLKSSSESIDKAVLELTRKAKFIEYPGDWADCGSWKSLAIFLNRESNGNELCGKVIMEDSSNCSVFSMHRLVVTIGLEGLIIVETDDSVLVMNKENTKDIRKVVARLGLEGFEEYL